MDNRGLLDLIIVRIPGLSSREKISLCENFDCEDDFFRMGTPAGAEAIIARKIDSTWNVNDIHTQAEQDLKSIRLKGLDWVAWTDKAYPPLLREIYDPPAVLFYRGNLPDPEKPLIAIVGTRHPSPQAASQAYDLGLGIGRLGIAVVSGLALGIDAMAHRGNLEAGGQTIAVLGSGPDEVYPQANRLLARRILETGGCLISEYPPGTSPFKWNFPARNRIISGIARGTVIVEAPESSGALITARHAIEQNRDLWVASAGADTSMGSKTPFDRRGSIRLVESGASVISDASDIHADWYRETPVYSDNIESYADHNNCGRSLAESLAKSLNVDL
jgi:DNA processing protein